MGNSERLESLKDEAELKIFEEVLKERQYQDQLWGPASERQHPESLWLRVLDDYMHGKGNARKHESDFRTRMIKTAAIAIAAVKAYDSKDVQCNIEQDQ